MNIKIHEDSRTLLEFYPDAEIRHQVHYQFAHRFLPLYVQENPRAFFSHIFHREVPGDPTDPTRFIHSRWRMFEGMAGLIERESDPFNNGMIFRRVSDLTMSTMKVDGRPLVIVRMPTPERWGEAFFVGVALLSQEDPVSWPSDVQARVFTLEATAFENPGEDRRGIVCEWTKDDGHRNFGFEVPAEQGSFLRAVTAVLEAPDAPAAAESTPSKNGEAGTVSVGVRDHPTKQPPAHPDPEKPWWKIW